MFFSSREGVFLRRVADSEDGVEIIGIDIKCWTIRESLTEQGNCEGSLNLLGFLHRISGIHGFQVRFHEFLGF